MDRIRQAFDSKSGQACIIPFLNAGDPDFATAVRLFETVLNSGADMVEIGIPYSDPLADGPVIQQSALRSLNAGFSLPQAFELLRQVRSRTDKPLILFTYVNPVLQYGYSRFFQEAVAIGADGVIIPDLPFEESESVRADADAAGIALIPLVAPTSGEERIIEIAKNARGFVYCVSSLGVTGERARMSERLQDMVRTVKQHTNLPVAVGFGVSTPEQAQNIAHFADGVIVGSAYIRRLEQTMAKTDAPDADALCDTVRRFTEDLCRSVR